MKSQKTKITIVGSGYVGMSLAALLAEKNDVTILDIDEQRVSLINSRKSTINDPFIEKFFNESKESINATSSSDEAYCEAEFIIICTPTDYDEEKDCFNTSSVEKVASSANRINPKALIIIKSTIPLGFTDKLKGKLSTSNIIFSPEFLREGHALEDNLFPSRVIVGNEHPKSKKFSDILVNSASKTKIDVLSIPSKDAEAIKLFSNAYLAMRVSFFNEVDSFSLINGLNTKNIIDGICLDKRIGSGYNNPSFGYGGYCLPKDTKQLLANFSNTPQSLISAIVESNAVRKKFIVEEILKHKPKTVGIFRLIMKSGSFNFRSSAISDIMKSLINNNIEIIVYEPFLNSKIDKIKQIHDLDEFKIQSNIIVANRGSTELLDVQHKIFSRDVYNLD